MVRSGLLAFTSLACRLRGCPGQSHIPRRALSDRVPMGSDSGLGGQNYDGPGKTTVSILNEETGLLMVDAFSVQGFRLNNGMVVFGPMAIFPTCVLAWRNVMGPEEITAASLSVFKLLHPRPDVVLVGAGDQGGLDAMLTGGKKGRSRAAQREVVKQLRATGLNVDVMSTEHAVSTYNFLCQEGRPVGAALLPPDKVRMIRDEDRVRHTDDTAGLFQDPNPLIKGNLADKLDPWKGKEGGKK